MENIKKIIAFFSSFFILLNALIFGGGKIDNSLVIPEFENAVWDCESVLFNGEKKKITINGAKAAQVDVPSFNFTDKSFTMTFDKPDEKAFNYYGIKYSTNANLECVISYSEILSSKSETFFLAKSDDVTDFYSFIDNYACARSAVKINSIKFKILDDVTDANINIYGIATFMREKMSNTIYVSDDNYKLGVSLEWGGSLSYLEVLNQNVQAVRTSNGVIVARDAQSRYGGTLITSNVNLINRNDAGRLIQQSYYGTDGSSGDGYVLGEFMNNPWPYNPVQGGNRHEGKSKIVDYVINEDSIYIKCRPMDWGQKDSWITPSYMEATYTLVDGVVKCECRFTDFSLYNHPVQTQEIPAFYCIEPLNSYRYYSGNAPWTMDADITVNDSLIFWPDAGYPNFKTTENWSAFTNAQGDFGFGLYVPDNEYTLAGVADRGGKINDDPSKSSPTSYIAVVKNLKIKNFETLEYSYLLAAGAVDEIRNAFYDNKDLVNNNALTEYCK